MTLVHIKLFLFRSGIAKALLDLADIPLLHMYNRVVTSRIGELV